MKFYIKPIIEVIELRAEEGIAKDGSSQDPGNSDNNCCSGEICGKPSWGNN